jgi:hypothetical protein
MLTRIMESIVARKRDAELAYYQTAKAALMEHMATTEKGLRRLKDLPPPKADKIIEAIRKRHDKLLRRIDRQVAVLSREL